MLTKYLWEETITDIKIYRECYRGDYNLHTKLSFELLFLILATPFTFVFDIVFFPFELFYLICKKIVYGKGEDKQ